MKRKTASRLGIMLAASVALTGVADAQLKAIRTQTAITPAERKLVADRMLARCDALDGLMDGMVQDTAACQAAFNFQRDVPTCSGARDGSCLTAEQKTRIAGVARKAYFGALANIPLMLRLTRVMSVNA